MRDKAIETYCQRISRDYPVQAATWAESIGDESARLRQIERVGRYWLAEDRDKATRWLESTALPVSKIEALVKRVQ